MEVLEEAEETDAESDKAWDKQQLGEMHGIQPKGVCETVWKRSSCTCHKQRETNPIRISLNV